MGLYADIEKDFGGFRLKTRFEAENGVLGILGASGCGKSMTLRCIAGLIKPDRGKIILDSETLFDSERRINLSPQRRHVGLLFQNYALFPNMTVWQNLMTGIRAREADKKQAASEISLMMKRFHLDGLEHHLPSQLSGGQQQRTALARILLSRPRLLMLDEPFSALDGYLRWNMELELYDILESFDSTILFVSHSRDEIYRICDHVCVMNQGLSGPVIPVKTLFEKPETLSASLLSGCKNCSAARAVGPFRIYARDWGVVLESDQPTDTSVTHVGIRSHFIHAISGQEAASRPNVIRGRITRIVEDVFSMIIMVAPQPSDPDQSAKPLPKSKPAENRQSQENGQNQENEQSQEAGRSQEIGQSRGVGQLRLEMTKEEWNAYCKENPGICGADIFMYIEKKDLMLLK